MMKYYGPVLMCSWGCRWKPGQHAMPDFKGPCTALFGRHTKTTGCVCVCVGGGGGGASQADYLQWGHLEPFLQSNGGRYTVIRIC